jgi:hypothetical protein
MSMPELLYGARPADGLGRNAPVLDPGLREEFKLPDVEVHYCLFEVPMASALPRLPASLHPSVPALLGVTCWRCSDGPLGAFTLVYLGLACRTGIKPRHLVHGAFCDRPDVGRWLGARYGLDCRVARLHSLETYDRVHTRVEVDGDPVLEITTADPQPLTGRGAMVKYSPALNAARIGDHPALVQMEASFDFKRVARGRPQVLHYVAAALGDATIAPHYPISGAFAVVDITLHPARFRLDLELPAERGGARKI